MVYLVRPAQALPPSRRDLQGGRIISMKRTTPFSQMFLNNMSCFSAEQIKKIEAMEPEHCNGRHRKASFGLLAENTDFRKSGIRLFKFK